VQGPGTEDPGKTLGLIGFVLSLLGGGLISLIIGVIARSQSKKAGFKNGFALAAIIISIISIVISIIITIAFIALSKSAVDSCKQNTTTTTNADGSVSTSCSVGGESTSNGTSSEGSSATSFDITE
jgi:hypothetical protein